MKSTYTAAIALLALMIVGMGCGLVQKYSSSKGNANSNKTLTDKAIDTAIGEEKTGVPQCDEVIGMLAAEANNPDDSYVTKAVKGTVLNKIKASLRESIEQNKNDKAQLAKSCTEFKAQLLKYKTEEANKAR